MILSTGKYPPMHPVLRNFLALLAAIPTGMVVNGSLIALGPHIIALPEGVQNDTMENLAAAMAHFEARHFLMPFLAHALGTFSGAWVGASLGAGRRWWPALITGLAFLASGVMMVVALRAPLWFNALDLLVAYLPMAYLGWRFRLGRQHRD